MMLNKNNLFLILLIFSLSMPVLGQVIFIEGIVTDSRTKEVLPFATVGIAGTTIGTATNSEGRFILSIPQYFRDSVLFCSYMGYKNFEIPYFCESKN